jgi:hypothetical protein
VCRPPCYQFTTDEQPACTPTLPPLHGTGIEFLRVLQNRRAQLDVSVDAIIHFLESEFASTNI